MHKSDRLESFMERLTKRDKMVKGYSNTLLSQEIWKFAKNVNHLRKIMEETNKSMKAIDNAGFFHGEDVDLEQTLIEAGTVSRVEELSTLLDRQPMLVVHGQSCEARARFVNSLLGCKLLPVCGGNWRWIRILYGQVGHVSLTVGLEFEVVEKLRAHERPWSTIPEDDLKRPPGEDMVVEHLAVLDVQVCNPIVRYGTTILVVPNLDHSKTDERRSFSHLILCDSVLPVLVYAQDSTTLTQKHSAEIHELRQILPKSPIFFANTSALIENNSSISLQGNINESQECNGAVQDSDDATEQIKTAAGSVSSDGESCEEKPSSSTSLSEMDRLPSFVRAILKSHLLLVVMHLNQIHCAMLRRFILCAFDKAREMQITPRRIRYALEKESELYETLIRIGSEKQTEMTELITITIEEMRTEMLEEAANYVFQGIGLSGDGLTVPMATLKTARLAAAEIQQLVLSKLSHAVAQRLVLSMDCLQDSVVGTLFRTLSSLEKSDRPESNNYFDVLADTLLNNSEESDVTDSWDISSCTESFESVNLSTNRSGQSASDALKQILSAAYSVQLSTSGSSSLLNSLLERLWQFLHSCQFPWAVPAHLDEAWKRRVATEMIDSLSPQRLAKSISSQFRDRVRVSHDSFLSALRSLSSHYNGHLERTEKERLAIRDSYAPRLARLALENTSIGDMVKYGMPHLSREIGRGQYGVVYSCESWGGAGPCAVKSVVPPDDKHWADLAMELYYLRTVPEHPRIVRLRGSVIDYSYGSGCSHAVLLVMDRLNRDLYSGLKSGLSWKSRLQIALDVVEGIRFLHSQGLVHRDVKLKNVLLDCDNRAKLTDLGFCITEAMMSGSLVGTPIHMAPEMHAGRYDSSVDVYAFGILFWYICSGGVQLPAAFEKFHNKEQLWTSVQKGIRPERLPFFEDSCWNLMEACWSGDPTERPLLGFVQPHLEKIMDQYQNASRKPSSSAASASSSSNATSKEAGGPSEIPTLRVADNYLFPKATPAPRYHTD